MGMAGRDNAAALRAYSTLAGRNRGPRRCWSILARARSDGRGPKALESYRQAGQLDAENPAPFLRMGILYGRAGDTAASEAAFKRAEELYSARGRVEGVATVSLERGVMLDRADRSDEAVVALQRALQLATSVDSNYLRAAVLFKLSSVAGYKGRFDDAEKYAREALRLSEEFEGLNPSDVSILAMCSSIEGNSNRPSNISGRLSTSLFAPAPAGRKRAPGSRLAPS